MKTNLKLFDLRKNLRKVYREFRANRGRDRFDVVNLTAEGWIDHSFDFLNWRSTEKTKELASEEVISRISSILEKTIQESQQDLKSDWSDLEARGRLRAAQYIRYVLDLRTETEV